MPNSNVYAPTPQNTSYQGTVAGNAQISGSTIVPSTITVSGLNGLSSADFTIANNTYLVKPIVEMKLLNGQIQVTFNANDGSQDVKMEFAPEANITTNEFMKIMLLVQGAGVCRMSNQDTLKYVRTNSLERHFKFTV